MTTTIIYAHPYKKSFNYAILEQIVTRLANKGEPYQIIDLYKDGFDPVYSSEELALFSQGQALAPLVHHYQDLLRATDQLVLIFPIWWNDAPAILKGFFDKVLLKSFAYTEGKTGLLTGELGHIHTAYLYTTSSSPTLYLESLAGHPTRNIAKMVLKQIGIRRVFRQNLGRINRISEKNGNLF